MGRADAGTGSTRRTTGLALIAFAALVAVIAPASWALRTRSASTTIAPDEKGAATAKCRKGSEAVSGGFFAPGGFDLNTGSEIYFYESHRVGKRRWTASGLNQGDPARLTAYAYCEKN